MTRLVELAISAHRQEYSSFSLNRMCWCPEFRSRAALRAAETCSEVLSREEGVTFTSPSASDLEDSRFYPCLHSSYYCNRRIDYLVRLAQAA